VTQSRGRQSTTLGGGWGHSAPHGLYVLQGFNVQWTIALTLLVGQQEGNPAYKKLDVGLLVMMI